VSAYRAAAIRILDSAGARPPKVGMILGSGLSGVADAIDNPSTLPYAELEGFPDAKVSGHAGQLVLGELGGVSVACLQGRWHAYEGHALVDLAIPIRALKAAGCEILLITCAAGSLRAKMPPGSLMMLTDHINWPGLSPLIGPNDDTLGSRFTDLSHAYDPALQGQLREAASDAGLELHEGVYLWCLGPSFETPAEIRAFAHLGADAVGMSTVPETLVARHCGLAVAAVAVITNLAAGLQSDLSHEQTLAGGSQAAPQLARLIKGFMKTLVEPSS
jgi:inosine/guanosine/xanthosine phosphorylase family protein